MTAKDLKNALLQEAVQGKLVPQIAAEGSDRDLLNAIRKQKAELIKAGKLKKEKPLPEITPDEIPFDIPESWCWCRLGELITFVGGYAYDSHSFIEKSEYQVLRLGNVKNGYLQLSAKPVYINAELADKTKAFKCITNDILVTMTGTRLKRDYFFTTLISENNKNLYLNQRVGCLRPTKIIYASFLAWILKSKTVLDYIFEFETGTANQGNLGSENIKTIPIPLPPLSEQKRIVSAIEQFMPLIEEYGKAQEELDKLNNEIPEKLKKAILQEAIQGKLVPQIAEEGNAQDLLHKIETERKKSNPKYKPAPRIEKRDGQWFEDDENITGKIPFEIPQSWCFVRLKQLCWLENGVVSMGEKLPYLEAKYLRGIISAKIIQTGVIVDQPQKIILVDGENSGEVFCVHERGYLGSTFKILVQEELICEKYIQMLLLRYKEMFKNNKKGSAIPHLNKEIFRDLIVGLPPIDEQKRIVEKLEELLGVIDKMK